jgi:hypothetical protein
MSQQNARPIAVFRAGCCQASIWAEEVEEGKRPKCSVKIQKQYRDENGNWQKTDRFFRDELALLMLVTQKAYEAVALQSKDAAEAVPAGSLRASGPSSPLRRRALSYDCGTYAMVPSRRNHACDSLL